MKRILWLSVTVLSLFAVTLALFRVLQLDLAADFVTRKVAEVTIGTLTDRSLDSTTKGNTIWFQIQEHTTRPAPDEIKQKVIERRRKQGKVVKNVKQRVMIVHDVSVNRENVNTTLPMFLAVVVALAGRRGWRMFAVLIGGTAILIMLDGLSLSAMIWQDPGSRLDKTFTYHVLKLISVWSEGGWLMAPLFVGAVISLTWLRDETSSSFQDLLPTRHRTSSKDESAKAD